jgi:hypothetical protein
LHPQSRRTRTLPCSATVWTRSATSRTHRSSGNASAFTRSSPARASEQILDQIAEPLALAVDHVQLRGLGGVALGAVERVDVALDHNEGRFARGQLLDDPLDAALGPAIRSPRSLSGPCAARSRTSGSRCGAVRGLLSAWQEPRWRSAASLREASPLPSSGRAPRRCVRRRGRSVPGAR